MEEQNKQMQKTPFGARIDTYYEDMFNSILEKYKDAEGNIPRGAKKDLLETIISNYVRGERNKEKEEVLALESEVNLIAENLNNILGIFKNIRSKAQDTLIIERESGKQKIENLSKELDTIKAKVISLEQENNSLKTSNNAFNSVKENLEKELEKLKQDLEKEKIDRIELEKELKGLKNTEKLNVSLEKELENIKQELHSVKNTSIDKDSKINKLETKFQDLSQELKEINSKKDKELKEIANRIRRESEIDIKQTKLDADMKVNTMQLQLIEAIKGLNDKENLIKETNKTLEDKEKEIKNLNTKLNIEIKKYEDIKEAYVQTTNKNKK